MIQLPKCLALIACDHVHLDPRCEQHTLIGTMLKIWAKSFPHIHPSLDVYFELTDGRGTGVAELAIVAPDLVTTVVSARREIRFVEPLWLYMGKFRFENLLLETKGHYTVRVSVDGEEIASRTLPVNYDPSNYEEEAQVP